MILIVLEVKNIHHDSLERSDYPGYCEYFYSADIDKENIIPVTLEIDTTECNKEFCLELLNSASSICERCARYYDELIYKLSDEQKASMHKHCDRYWGCCAIQEQMMEILMEVANFTLGEANAARKVVAKKQMSKIPELRKQVYEKISPLV